jgi:hypothetical protein
LAAMDLAFETGSANEPRGHALIYFTSAADSRVLAFYAVCLPITMELSKYVPPAFAHMVTGEAAQTSGVVPLPPVAEEVEGIAWLRRLADIRRDDLIDAGTLYSSDLPNVIQMTAQAAAEYGDLFARRGAPEVETSPSQPISVYQEMTESERLGRLTSLVGRYRDTLGMPENDLIWDELKGMAESLPSKYRASELLEWSTIPGEHGLQLATLHLQRSFQLLNEEYMRVAETEKRIQELRTQDSLG